MRKHEAKILNLLSKGNTSSEIGEQLKISSRTAEKHIELLKAAYGAKNAPHLVLKAIEKGVVKVKIRP